MSWKFTHEQRVLNGSIGGHKSWRQTPDRTARTAPGRAVSPSELAWHRARLGPEFDGCTREERDAAAVEAKRAYFARIAARSAEVRRAQALRRREAS